MCVCVCACVSVCMCINGQGLAHEASKARATSTYNTHYIVICPNAAKCTQQIKIRVHVLCSSKHYYGLCKKLILTIGNNYGIIIFFKILSG